VKALVKDEDLDKLFLPRCMIEDIKQMKTIDPQKDT
jgi:uncharacterized protein YfeS